MGFFGYARVLGLRRAAPGRFLAAMNDFKDILGRWDFPKGFFDYARILVLRRAALGQF